LQKDHRAVHVKMLEKNKEIIKLKALLESASSIIGDANIPGTAEFLKEV
jgi:hypothetical protein